MDNPYQPPQSKLENTAGVRVSVDGKRRIYSPDQVGGAAFFGGPLPSIYVLYKNFLILDKPDEAKKSLRYGALVTVAYFVCSLLLPTMISTPIYLGLVFGVRRVANKMQLRKKEIQDSDHYCFESNWRVASVSALGFLVTIAISVPLALVWAAYMGSPA